MNPTKKILVGLVAGAAALSLTACAPSLDERALDAAKVIQADFDRQEAAVEDLEAQRVALQAKIDAVTAKSEEVGDTSEMDQATVKAEAAYEAAETADEAYWDAEAGSPAEAAAEAEYDAANAEYEAAEEAVSELRDQEIEAWEAQQAQFERDINPLNKEMARLDALASESYSGQDMEMSFALMASCPELMADTQGSDMVEVVKNVEVTEVCVTTMETWAEKVS